MSTRMNYGKAAPGAMRAMSSLEKYIADCGLEPALKELVRLRASQINGCAYCVDMHSLDARAGGETEQRLYALPVWQETPFFSERERAALLWTEKLTLISVDHVPDEVYAQVSPHFSETELTNLTLLVATINAWNRFAISFRSEPGHYQPSAS
ncbi:carboxymuconolactone decarboxylase family protein [Dictyobacter kobayashii]|uniref:Alkyl hydroperoxide reductase AhpD n=1 Tax=Dictyobacter kobayashii TaxID=2014872 RepID=A0A402AYW7_9CHLR|nr:carboxymuconolactone decarboxylase family protein [Dictyobacter kobayashii]GCE24255.1 alkyl hydroperoxide reductase AhpD [Dictyobacter kobayashii]